MPPQSTNGRTAKWLVAARWPLLGLALLLAALAYRPAGQLAFDRSIERMFAEDDPQLEAWWRLKRTFGGNEIILAAYVDEQLLTDAGFDRLTGISQQLADVPGVAAVLSLDSPIGRQILRPNLGLARRFRGIFEGYTHSRDGRVAAITCMLEPEATAGTTREATIDQLRAIIERQPQGTLAGEPTLLADGFGAIEADGRRLGRTSTILLALTIIVCFRSLRWTLAPILVVHLALLLTQAALSVGGMRLSMVSSMLTAIVTVIGVATVVHVIIRFRDARGRGLTPRPALEESLSIVAFPIVLACLTDAVGFLALLVSQVEPVRDFGLMMAAGALMVCVSTFLLIPGVGQIGQADSPPTGEHRDNLWSRVPSRLLERALAHRAKILGAAAALAVVALAGSTRLEVETDFTRNFRADSRVVRSYSFVEDRLGGAGVWDIVLPAPGELDWPYVQRVLALEAELRNEAPQLTKVLSVADALEAAMLVRPENLPFEWMRNEQIGIQTKAMQSRMPEFFGAIYAPDPENPRQHFLRIMLRAQERQSAAEKRALIARVESIARRYFPQAEVTGYFVLMTSLIDSVVRDQWLAFGVATLGIGCMLLLAFGSPRLALAALVPNALPILMVTGVLGWFAGYGLKLNMGAAMIAAVSMGLSVDSSIHYLAEFRRQLAAGASRHDAIVAAQQNVGPAIVLSTLALIVGFLGLCLSDFVPTIYFGALVSLSMFGGMAGNLIILPLLLTLGDKQPANGPGEQA